MAMKNGFQFPREVEGWLSSTQGELLCGLAQLNPSLGTVVEIGSFLGRSTICLAQGCRRIKADKMYTIDNFVGDLHIGLRRNFFDDFWANIRKYQLEDWVIPLVSDSVQASQKWTKGIRLLFIDGNHSYQGVKKDFLTWQKFIPMGGIIAFHDSLSWPGIVRLIFELILKGDYEKWKTCLSYGGLSYAFRTARVIPRRERIKVLLWFLGLQCFTFNYKIVPLLIISRSMFRTSRGGTLIG